MAETTPTVELQAQRVCTHCNCGNLYDVIVQNVDAVTSEDQTVIATVAAEGQNECAEHGPKAMVSSATPTTTSIITTAMSEDSFFHWNKGTIKMLINQYRENYELFFSPNVKKRKAWEIIAHAIREKGVNVTGQQCESKWKNLQRNYRRIKSDVLNLGCTTSRWPYMSEMEEILSLRPADEVLESGDVQNSVTDETDPTLQMNGGVPGTNGIDAIDRSRKRKLDDEPTWFKAYRTEVQRRHEQRMALQRQLMDQHKLLTRQLIKVLEGFKK